jgi:polar amino acid transport system substrate-binding protein
MHIAAMRVLALLGSALLTVTLASCGSSSNESSGTSKTAPGAVGASDDKASLYNSLPDRIKASGEIVLGSSVAYPPYEFFDDQGNLQGFEPELSDAVSKYLGVPFKWSDASYDTLFSGLSSKRYDILWVGTNDTAEREKQFDFVDYLKSASGLVVKSGNPEGITTAEDMCGKSIAVARGSLQESFLESYTCQSDKITVISLGGDTEGQLQVKQGRAAGLLTNYPSGAYYADASDGSLDLVEELRLLPSFYGILLRKEDADLRDVLQQALQAVVDSGEYATILEKWGLTGLALPTISINGAAN